MLEMNSQEQLEFDVIMKVVSGKIPRKKALEILNVSERTLIRYLKSYSEKGVLGLKHGNYRKIPSNKTDSSLKKTVQGLVAEKYFDFNMIHCLEKLKKDEGIELKPETFRKWCHEIGMVKRAHHTRSKKVHKSRERMNKTGLMLQMDGSPHRWFGNKPSCLIGAIDDADNDVPFAEFFPAEDTISCMVVLQKIIEKRGIFEILYVDKAGLFAGPKRVYFSQVKRACEELGIHIIYANSAQAKGRIEKLWDTLQDRLIPEMRIRNINTYANANKFLQEVYLPSEYALKFKVVPTSLDSAYKALPANVDLNEIFCLKESRQVKNDHTFSFNSKIYLIESDLKYSIKKQSLQIRTYQNLQWKVFFGKIELQIKEITLNQKVSDRPQSPDAFIVGKVRMDAHVGYLNHYYSTDEKYIGEKVSIFEKNQEVLIFYKGKLIEKHPKLMFAQATNSTKPHHKTPWEQAMKSNSVYMQAARRLGPNVEKVVLCILERGGGFVDSKSIWGIINADKKYSPTMIEKSCECALQMSSPDYKTIMLLLQFDKKLNLL